LRTLTANKNKPGKEQVFWQVHWSWSGVMSGFERGAICQNALKIR